MSTPLALLRMHQKKVFKIELKITFKQIVLVLFQCFLKALEQHWLFFGK